MSQPSSQSKKPTERESERRRRSEPGSAGWWASPEFLSLADRPGFLRAFEGGQKLRELYAQESTRKNMNYASDFVKACYFGFFPDVEKAIASGTAPDITGQETDLRIGYLSFVVLGCQRVEYLGPGQSPYRHADVLRYLIKMGCPLEQADICGYTALYHAVGNSPKLDLARILLDAGASPNHRNKFGAPPILEVMQQNHIGSIDLLMEYGASLDIPDADGITGNSFYVITGPQVTAVVEKWMRKRRGEEDEPEERKACHVCGKRSVSFCSGCRKVHYCSKECQKKDWPAHKISCKKVDSSTTLTIRPCYELINRNGWIMSNSDLARTALREYGVINPGVNSEPVDTTKQKKKPAKKNTIIKVQLEVKAGPFGPVGPAERGDMLCYNQKKSLICHIVERYGKNEYQLLSRVIREKGVRVIPGAEGVKAYFYADLVNRDELVIHIGEVLPAQPF